MPIAAVNGVQLYYEEYGEGATTIVFAHGASGNHLSWWQQIPYFSQRYRCITYSQRGFHLSTRPAGSAGAAAFVDDLAALLDHLEIQETALVAQSMSGLTCFGFAQAYPRRTKALVMSDTVLGVPGVQAKWMESRGARPEQPEALGGFAPSFQQREPALYFLYAQMRDLNVDADRREMLRDRLTPNPDVSMLDMPILFLFGAEDTSSSPEMGRLAHSMVPGSRFIEVPGCGHSVYWEQAEEFNRIVGDFLAESGI
jgi:3-oxoadipate enol-lactonase